MAYSQASVLPGRTQYVTFNLGNELYGIDVMQVQKLLRESEVVPVPGAPRYVLGITNLRGKVVSVIDGRARFGLPTAESTLLTRIIIVETQQQIIGILVDSVSELVDVDASEIETVPNVGNDQASRYLDGVVNLDNSLLILVDPDKLLKEDELDK